MLQPAPSVRPVSQVRSRPRPLWSNVQSAEHAALVELLAGAADRRLPTFERARLLTVFAHQLDKALIHDRSARWLPHRSAHVLYAECDRLLHEEVLPALAAEGVVILPWDASHRTEQAWLRALFRDAIYPLLTPLAVDSTHPFPCAPPRSVHVAALLRDRGSTHDRFAYVPVRERLFEFGPFSNGFVRLDAQRLISLDMVIGALLEDLFQGMQVVEVSTFRCIPAGTGWVSGRRFLRLEVGETTTLRLSRILLRNLSVADETVYRMRSPLGLVERVAAMQTASGNGHS